MVMATIENDFLKVIVNPLGGTLSSVYFKKHDKEILYQADDGGWGKQDLVCFPFIGRSNDYFINGKLFHCDSNHGFLQNLLGEIKEYTGNSVSIVFRDNEATRKVYPFSFKITLTVAVESNSLLRRYRIENKSEGKMCFSIGDHAAYKAVFGKSILHLGESGEYLPMNGLLLSLEAAKLPYSGDILLTKSLFENTDTIVLRNPRHPFSLDNGNGVNVSYHFRSPYIALWSPSKLGDFLCVEPWWGLSPYENMPLDMAKREGVNLCKDELSFEERISYRSYEE